MIRVADVFYSESVMDFLGQKNLSEDAMYCCQRLDVDPIAMEYLNKGTRAFLEACARNVVIAHSRDFLEFSGCARLRHGAVGDFLLLSRQRFHEIRGFHETEDVCSLDVDAMALHAAHGAGAEQVYLPEDHRVYKLSHSSSCHFRTRLRFQSLNSVMRNVLPLGIRQSLSLIFNFPKRTVKGMDGIYFDSHARHFLPHARQWAKGLGPFYLNGPDWGLAAAKLSETRMCNANWEEA